jgi:hypothetical protein
VSPMRITQIESMNEAIAAAEIDFAGKKAKKA